MTAASKPSAKAQALAELAKHHGPQGQGPFPGVALGSAQADCVRYISGAQCLLKVLAAAYEDADELNRFERQSEIEVINPKIIAGALEGIDALLDVASLLAGEK